MMRHWLISFMAACATGLCAAAGGSPLDEYLLFETFGDDCYADGSPLWEGECYALVWRNGDAATRVGGLFNSDGTVVDESTTKILAVFSAAVQTNYEGNVYSCARRSWSLMNSMDMQMWEKRGGVLSLFVFDTRRWNTETQAWELAGCDVEERTIAAVRGYGLVTDLEDIRRGMSVGIFEWDTTAHGTSFVTSDELTLFGDTTEQYSGTVNKAVDVSDELVVSFDANGGEPVPATMRTVDGLCGALPDAVRAGYAFVGWFTAATGGEEVTPDTVVTGDVTYYARWQANAYTVTFHANGGEGEMEPQEFHYDEAQKLRSNDFVSEDRGFLGWATEADGEVAYADRATVKNLTDEKGGNVDLYAVWTEEPLPGVSVNFGVKSTFTTKDLFGLTLKSCEVSGLPTGMSYNAKDGTVTGTVTKKSLIKTFRVTFAKKSVKYEMLLVVKAPPTVDVELWGDPASDTNGCSVAGAGAYVVGKKVSLSVSLPKASSSRATEFLGWYLRKGEQETPWPKSSTYRETSVSYTMKSTSLSLVAKVRVETRDSVKVDCAGLRVGGGVLCAGVDGAAKGIPLQVETISGNPKSVVVTGLPTGMTYDKKTNTIKGAPTKAGEKKTVTIKVTTVNGVTQSVTLPVVIAPMDAMAVGTFAGFVVNTNGDDVGTIKLTVKGSGALSAKVVRAAGSLSFSDTAWNSCTDGVYSVTMKAKTGERLALRVNSRAAWNDDQLTGTFTDAKGVSRPVTAQRNALADPWYFAAVGDETSGWALTYADKSHADLTVKLGAAGATTVAGALAGTPVVKKGKRVPVSYKISASGCVNVGLMTNGVLVADFVPVVKIAGKKTALSIRTNLWMDRKDASEADARFIGEAKVTK